MCSFGSDQIQNGSITISQNMTYQEKISLTLSKHGEFKTCCTTISGTCMAVSELKVKRYASQDYYMNCPVDWVYNLEYFECQSESFSSQCPTRSKRFLKLCSILMYDAALALIVFSDEIFMYEINEKGICRLIVRKFEGLNVIKWIQMKDSGILLPAEVKYVMSVFTMVINGILYG